MVTRILYVYTFLNKSMENEHTLYTMKNLKKNTVEVTQKTHEILCM